MSPSKCCDKSVFQGKKDCIQLQQHDAEIFQRAYSKSLKAAKTTAIKAPVVSCSVSAPAAPDLVDEEGAGAEPEPELEPEAEAEAEDAVLELAVAELDDAELVVALAAVALRLPHFSLSLQVC